MKAFARIFIRILFRPTLYYSRLMYAIGRWDRWNWITPDLLLGGLPRRSDYARLNTLGVKGIVNFCAECPGDAALLEQLGQRQLHLATTDFHPPSAAALREAVEFIEQTARKGGRTYVHCKAGRGRAATAALCYLMSKYDLDPQAAYRMLQSSRRHVDRGLARRAVVREWHDIRCIGTGRTVDPAPSA